MAPVENSRPNPDQVLVDIASYVDSQQIKSKEAFESARIALFDALGCGLEALSYPECTKLLGPAIPGVVVSIGAKVPGTNFELDPITAAFDIGFTRLVSLVPIQRAIVRGLKEGRFAFTIGAAPTLGPDGKFQVSWDRIRFETTIAEDEVDLDSGFIMLPTALPPKPVPKPPEVREPGREPVQEPPPAVTPTTETPGEGAGRVVLTFRADRNTLFQAWPALANLSDLAGEVSVTVTAAPDKPMDKGKLENGVLEPLREIGLIKE